MVLLPAPVPGPPGDRRAVRAAAGPGADHRAVPRRRLRQQVLHQDGAADRGHRAQGRPPGADPQRGARVDDHHPAARHDRADAHRRRRRRHPARPRMPGLAGHRRLRGQRPPGHRHGRRRRPRPLPLAGPGRAGPLRLHQHQPVRLLPRLRRHPPAVDRGVAAGRGSPPPRHRPAGDPPPEPPPPRRRSPPRRQAPRRRPHRRRRKSRRPCWLGRRTHPFGSQKKARSRRVRGPARGRGPPGVDGDGADGTRTGRSPSWSAPPRWARVPAR